MPQDLLAVGPSCFDGYGLVALICCSRWGSGGVRFKMISALLLDVEQGSSSRVVVPGCFSEGLDCGTGIRQSVVLRVSVCVMEMACLRLFPAVMENAVLVHSGRAL